MNDPHKHSYGSTGKCSCGHIHEHSHSCGHEHALEHLNQELFGQAKEVPAVFSHSIQIELKKEVSGEELKALLIDWIEDLKQWISQNKYFIGHIKIFAENGKSFNIWLSTTGGKINEKHSPDILNYKVEHCTINMTVIVFGAHEQNLREVTLNSLNSRIFTI